MSSTGRLIPVLRARRRRVPYRAARRARPHPVGGTSWKSCRKDFPPSRHARHFERITRLGNDRVAEALSRRIFSVERRPGMPELVARATRPGLQTPGGERGRGIDPNPGPSIPAPVAGLAGVCGRFAPDLRKTPRGKRGPMAFRARRGTPGTVALVPGQDEPAGGPYPDPPGRQTRGLRSANRVREPEPPLPRPTRGRRPSINRPTS